MRYAFLNAERTIVNIVEIASELATDFDAHYLGEYPFGIGDQYPKEDLKPLELEPEPTETEKLQAEVTRLKAQNELQAQQQTFLEDCLLEMGSIVYA